MTPTCEAKPRAKPSHTSIGLGDALVVVVVAGLLVAVAGPRTSHNLVSIALIGLAIGYINGRFLGMPGRRGYFFGVGAILSTTTRWRVSASPRSSSAVISI